MPRQYPAELRRQICERMLAGERIDRLKEEFGISDYTLYRWRRQARPPREGRWRGQGTQPPGRPPAKRGGHAGGAGKGVYISVYSEEG